MRSNTVLSKRRPSKKARRKIRHSDAVETSPPSDMFEERYLGMLAGAFADLLIENRLQFPCLIIHNDFLIIINNIRTPSFTELIGLLMMVSS